MIDTHAHMYAEAFADDIDDAISRAKSVGVKKILLPNIDTDSIAGLNKLVDGHPDFFYRMMGLHPCSVDVNYERDLSIIKKELDSKTCIAVGEIGIDLYWDKTKQKLQEEAFLKQCEWAIDSELPVVIHSRDK